MSRFETTHWSVVLRSRGEQADARAALESLCRTYRPPVLAYIRARGHAPDVAEDLAQGFFVSFIERAVHAQADPARGRFRSLLLTALKHFLGDEVDRERALKRGGAVQHAPLDAIDTHDQLDDARQPTTPEQVFERSWAETVLRAALHRLQAEIAKAGKTDLFDALSEFLIERPSEDDYARLAETLQMKRGTLAVAVHRLRARLQACVREELAETAADAASFDQEIDHMHKTLPHLLAPG
ncbi:MAG: sigma-70 family RNA polymerase sigma factor [Proteobacteria bacterium]|uniref:RNA polymerase sigma factor n=1 Tax=Rudaea sp. TaxID=2136325 RepID=UPI001DBDDE9D|nr:sigma-70 family RNA polymerase sigma factor [Pseudomonadota bacterium]MBS0566651.1 sigma-70 family RNA polymerase sigma factor [Pseudomonadota bacterium]